MTASLRRLMVAALSVAALAAAPTAVLTVAPPDASSSCPPGQTGVTHGCAPFCLPGLVLDTQTGLCVKAPALPPPPPPPRAVNHTRRQASRM
jgi:hypothetical protein